MQGAELATAANLIFAAVDLVVIVFIDKIARLHPDMHPLTGFVDKQTVETHPNLLMMKTMWGMMFFAIACGYVLLIKFKSQIVDLYPPGYHIGIFSVLSTTAPWFVFMCFEKFVAIALLVGAESLGFLLAFVSVLQRRAACKPGQYPRWIWLYDRAVVDGMAACTAWYVHSVVYFGNLAIAFVDGPGLTAVERGNCNPGLDCGLMLVAVFVLFVFAWFLCDLVIFPQYTRHVKLMYPVIWYICIAVLLDCRGGVELLETIYIGLLASSFVIWLLRDRLQRDWKDSKKLD